MQIRKCALIEMFSLVLIGMFSPFFHIIGSRIGAFGLFPFLDAVCLFNFGGTHTSVRQNAARTHGPGCAERAVPHGWTRAERISRPTAQAQDRTGPRQPGESPAAASCRANPAAAAQPRTTRGAATARPAARRRSRRHHGAPPRARWRRAPATATECDRLHPPRPPRPPRPRSPAAVGAADAAAQRTRGRGGGAGNERG